MNDFNNEIINEFKSNFSKPVSFDDFLTKISEI